jgi:hypothetical protein
VAEAVALKPWQDMQVNVKHFLARRLAVGQEQIDTLRPDARSPNCGRESLCRFEKRTTGA